MINKKRVQRIKNLIYAFIILVLFLPLILVSILSLRLLGQIDKLSDKIDQLGVVVSSQTASSLPEGGYVLEPQDQSSKGGNVVPKTTEEKNQQATGENQAPDASGILPEADGVSPLGQQDMPSVGNGVITKTGGEDAPEENSVTAPLPSDDTPISQNNISVFDGEKGQTASQAETVKTNSDSNTPKGVNGNPRMGR